MDGQSYIKMNFVREQFKEISTFIRDIVLGEKNNQYTRRNVRSIIGMYLKKWKKDGKIYDFIFQCDNILNTKRVIYSNELVARIIYKISKDDEFKDYKITISPGS